MPLINLNATTRIEIGEDWYELRNELGFYDETVMLVDAVDPDELRSFKLIDEGNGIVKSRKTPGEMVARRNFFKVQAYLVNWSHVENPEEEDKDKRISIPLTPENIKCIPPKDAKILMNRIEELEDSIPAPFRDEEGTKETE